MPFVFRLKNFDAFRSPEYVLVQVFALYVTTSDDEYLNQ